MSTLSIEALPVEVFHQIFNHLDAETIFLSVRPVSKLFRSIVNSYDRYVLDFNLMSKANFNVLCRSIYPQSVISLIFSNKKIQTNQIDLFISFNHIEKFTHLRSLTVLEIDEYQLNFILERINLNLLASFAFSIRKYDDGCREKTIDLLTALVTRSNLVKLKARLVKNRLLNLSCQLNSTIQHLTIIRDIDTETLLKILTYSPHLHTLIIKRLPNLSYTDMISKCFPQIISLTIKELSGSQDMFELFLSKTPSLMHMSLNGQGVELDGQRWEKFITNYLPQLKKFAFDLYEHTRYGLAYTPIDIERIISSFQTPFWIEQKKWFVICEYTITHPYTISVTSSTMYSFGPSYSAKSTRLSLSTCPILINNGQPIIDRLDTFCIDLDRDSAHVDDEEENVSHLDEILTFILKQGTNSIQNKRSQSFKREKMISICYCF